MKVKNSEIIRKGDFVRIVNPSFFIRCGYPLTLKEVKEEVEDIHMAKIDALFESFGIKDKSIRKRSYREIIKSVAYEILRSRKFGGNERRIYTHHIPEVINRTYKVGDVKTCVTGDYVQSYGGSCRYSSCDDYEYEPAYLDNQKSHRILLLTYINQLEADKHGELLEWENNDTNWESSLKYLEEMQYNNKTYSLAIESNNVKKIILPEESKSV